MRSKEERHHGAVPHIPVRIHLCRGKPVGGHRAIPMQRTVGQRRMDAVPIIERGVVSGPIDKGDDARTVAADKPAVDPVLDQRTYS